MINITVDRFRWLVHERKYQTLDGAVEIAKASPDLLAEIERLWAIPEALATMIEGFNQGQIRMAAGEMTAQEMRTVQAVQRWWVSAIRHKAQQLLNQQSSTAANGEELPKGTAGTTIVNDGRPT